MLPRRSGSVMIELSTSSLTSTFIYSLCAFSESQPPLLAFAKANVLFLLLNTPLLATSKKPPPLHEEAQRRSWTLGRFWLFAKSKLF